MLGPFVLHRESVPVWLMITNTHTQSTREYLAQSLSSGREPSDSIQIFMTVLLCLIFNIILGVWSCMILIMQEWSAEDNEELKQRHNSCFDVSLCVVIPRDSDWNLRWLLQATAGPVPGGWNSWHTITHRHICYVTCLSSDYKSCPEQDILKLLRCIKCVSVTCNGNWLRMLVYTGSAMSTLQLAARWQKIWRTN